MVATRARAGQLPLLLHALPILILVTLPLINIDNIPINTGTNININVHTGIKASITMSTNTNIDRNAILICKTHVELGISRNKNRFLT